MTATSSTVTQCPSLCDVVKALNDIAPLHLAESWDNVGLLVEPSKPQPIANIMLTIDLTESVMEEALSKDVKFIMSYHPPIFRPLKSLGQKSWKERLMVSCLENRIAVYSPHTALDAIKDGINDWLLSPYPLRESWPINQSSEDTRKSNHRSYRIEASLSPDDCKLLKQFENVSKIQTDTSDSTRTVILCDGKVLPNIIATLSKSDLGKSTIHLTKLESKPLPGFGVGRVGILKEPLVFQQIIEKTKNLIGQSSVRLALAPKHSLETCIGSIAVCAGSGGSVLKDQQVDLLITGEMSHHEVLDALYQNGSSVLLCEHTNTERGFLDILKGRLVKQLNCPSVNVFVAQSDRDPLKVV